MILDKEFTSAAPCGWEIWKVTRGPKWQAMHVRAQEGDDRTYGPFRMFPGQALKDARRLEAARIADNTPELA